MHGRLLINLNISRLFVKYSHVVPWCGCIAATNGDYHVRFDNFLYEQNVTFFSKRNCNKFFLKKRIFHQFWWSMRVNQLLSPAFSFTHFTVFTVSNPASTSFFRVQNSPLSLEGRGLGRGCHTFFSTYSPLFSSCVLTRPASWLVLSERSESKDYLVSSF